jgi:hypothetical protein
MKHAKKIRLDLPTIDLNKIQERSLGKHVVFENQVGVDRYHFDLATYFKIRDCLPKDLIPYILDINLSIIKSTVPHTHSADESVINCYLEPSNYVTTFYDGEIDSKAVVVSDYGNLIYEADLNKIIPVEQFIAQPGDIYILNTRVVHSVAQADNTASGYDRFRPIRDDVRKVIQIYTLCPFEKTCKMFND